MRSSFIHPRRLTTSQPRLGGAVKMYGQTAKGKAAAGAGGGGGGGEIGTRARSTAEEFSRIAAEKTEASVEEGVKETLWKKAKDAVASAKDKLSEANGKEKP